MSNPRLMLNTMTMLGELAKMEWGVEIWKDVDGLFVVTVNTHRYPAETLAQAIKDAFSFEV